MEGRAVTAINVRENNVQQLLPLQKGERVTILSSDTNWLLARNSRGQYGMVPRGYVMPLFNSKKKSTSKYPSLDFISNNKLPQFSDDYFEGDWDDIQCQLQVEGGATNDTNGPTDNPQSQSSMFGNDDNNDKKSAFDTNVDNNGPIDAGGGGVTLMGSDYPSIDHKSQSKSKSRQLPPLHSPQYRSQKSNDSSNHSINHSSNGATLMGPPPNNQSPKIDNPNVDNHRSESNDKNCNNTDCIPSHWITPNPLMQSTTTVATVVDVDATNDGKMSDGKKEERDETENEILLGPGETLMGFDQQTPP